MEQSPSGSGTHEEPREASGAPGSSTPSAAEAAATSESSDDQLTQAFDPLAIERELSDRDRVRLERERIRSELDPWRADRERAAKEDHGLAAAPTPFGASVTPEPVVTPSQPPPTKPSAGSATVPTKPAPVQQSAAPSRPIEVRRLRRGRLAIRKVDPWTVLKFSLVFYFCMLLIMLLGTAIIFAVLKAFGVIDNLESLLSNVASVNTKISGGVIFRWFFLIGLLGTVVFSAVTTFMAFLYNLIADVVGGIELLVTERE